MRFWRTSRTDNDAFEVSPWADYLGRWYGSGTKIRSRSGVRPFYHLCLNLTLIYFRLLAHWVSFGVNRFCR
jgi:hypothetical protein